MVLEWLPNSGREKQVLWATIKRNAISPLTWINIFSYNVHHEETRLIDTVDLKKLNYHLSLLRLTSLDAAIDLAERKEEMKIQKSTEKPLRDGQDNLEQRVEERTSKLKQEIQQRIEAEEVLRKNQAQLKRQKNQIEFMQYLARIANEAKSLRQGMEATLNRMCDYTGWDLGHAYLPEGDDLSILMPSGIWAVKGTTPERFAPFIKRTEQGRLRVGEGLFDMILQNGKPVLSADVSQLDSYSRQKMAIACGIHGGFGLAVMAGGQVVGVLEFYSTEKGLPPEELQDSLVDIGIQLGRVAERSHMLERLEQVAHEAQQANRAKSAFLSSMSHELRTPMNSILGFGQLLELNPKEPLSEQQKKCVAHIMRGGTHLLQLIDQILDLAKIEAKKLDLSIDEIILNVACQECLTLIDKIATDRGQSIYNDFGTPLTIEVDPIRFKQILLNLLSNAVKYNSEGGTITLATKTVPDKRIRISITDTGAGIAEEYQADLFVPFNRLGKETGEIEGTGIGLTITKQLVEAMDGKIGYETELGKGSTFWVEFTAIKPTWI